MVWDTFKAYPRGILISFKAHRDKIREAERDKPMEDIATWESLNKRQVTSEITGLLKRAYEQVKLIERDALGKPKDV